MASYNYTFQSGDTVTPTKLNDARTVSEIVNADIASDAAIAGTKIAPDFGSQNVATTGIVSGGDAARVVGGNGASVQSHGTVGSRLATTRWTADTNGSIFTMFKSRGAAVGTRGVVQSGDTITSMEFYGDDGTNDVMAARILAQVDGNTGTNDMPGRLIFSTTADGASTVTERMRITAAGNVGIGTTAPSSLLTVNGTASAAVFRTGALLSVANTGTEEGALMLSNSIQASRDQNICGSFRRTTSNGAMLAFYRDVTVVGSISVTTTATAYNTSSDYRLKENATPLASGLSTINQLAPVEFTWKADGSTGRGFIAHELQAVVPEAVTGAKDAVDAEGNPEYQGVDASKLVPYLVSAVKELKTRVEALEAA